MALKVLINCINTALSMVLILSSLVSFKGITAMELNQMATVTVVGAGPAGLLTAYRLKQAGINVRVIEARSRIGGRLFSYPQGTLELGAWSMGDGGNIELIQALSQELGLELSTGRMPFPAFALKDGQVIDIAADFKEVIGEDTEKTRVLIAAIIDESRTIQDVLNAFFKERLMLRSFCETLAWVYHGSPASLLSAKIYKEAVIELCLGGVSDLYTHEAPFIPLYRIKGGNDLLVKRLAEHLKGAIELNRPLKSISRGHAQSITLLFADGSSEETDTVILALPVSAYRSLEIEPGLIPSEQLDAIRHTCPGTVSKVFVPAQGNKHPSGFFIGNGFSAGISEDEQYLTMHWGEPVEMDVCQEAVRMLTSLLQWPAPTAYIKVQDENIQNYPHDAALIVDWPHTAYTNGSYCAFSPAQEAYAGHQVSDGIQVNKLFQPTNSIYFVGEAASVNAGPGSVGAAFESAEIAVKLIKKRLG